MPSLSDESPGQIASCRGFRQLVQQFGEGRVADAILAKWIADEGDKGARAWVRLEDRLARSTPGELRYGWARGELKSQRMRFQRARKFESGMRKKHIESAVQR